MKEVVKLIEKVVSEKRIDRHQGLNALLDFLIDVFDARHYTTEGGWFKVVAEAEKNEPHLFRILMIWMEKVAAAMEKGGWLDFFGEMYEEMYQSKGKASTLGQFFTPPALCDLLSFCTAPNEGKINDSACGSGRLLLAGGAASKFDRRNFYVGEDLDVVSVKMCALNLMIHGCRGRVVQHDTLMNPVLFDYGFRINDVRYPIPSPFYSLTRISLTKEDLEKANAKVRKRYGDNVVVRKYAEYEVVKPKEGAKPIMKPIYEHPPMLKVEEKTEKVIQKPVQMSLFDDF